MGIVHEDRRHQVRKGSFVVTLPGRCALCRHDMSSGKPEGGSLNDACKVGLGGTQEGTSSTDGEREGQGVVRSGKDELVAISGAMVSAKNGVMPCVREIERDPWE